MEPSYLQLLCLIYIVSLFRTGTGTGTECWEGCSYQCWDAKSHDVVQPSHFLIDMVEEKIVLTAKNSVCHISLDLRNVDNVRNVTPPDDVIDACKGSPRYEDAAKCHNFHHILLLPTPSNHMTIGESATPINGTILECGSNAFQPQCNYRLRADLTSVTAASGSDYVPPEGGVATTTALWLSTGRLVSAMSLNQAMFGMSSVPYNGPIQVGTLTGWFDRSVQFVSMYEIDNYIYIFFYEDPDETIPDVVYSRVARVCKNDTGLPDPNSPLLDHDIFTTFLKARMTCVSGGENGDIPYNYDILQDTFLVESESSDGSIERNLYAVFTSPENGPVGSAVCVYSFGDDEDSEDLTLETVFNGDYLQETGQDQFEIVPNPSPLTCSTTRSVEEANRHHLMMGTVHQTSQTTLHLQLTGYTLKKILVTSVAGVGGVNYDIMFAAGVKDGALVLLKTVFDSAQQTHYIISEVELKLSEDLQHEIPEITKMMFLGNGSSSEDSIYIGTTDGLFGIPVANCRRYVNDCCACVAARDPHCAYDTGRGACVTVDEVDSSGTLVQSVDNGDIDVCLEPPGSGDSSPPSDLSTNPVVTTPETMASSSVVTMTTSSLTPEPSVSPPQGVTPNDTTQSHSGTIMGSVFGFVGGMLFGIIVMIFCSKSRGRFVWSKYIGSSQLPPVEQRTRSASNKDCRGASLGANNYSKAEDYERNNSEMNPHSTSNGIVRVNPISNLSHHKPPLRKTNDIISDPPPYTPTKPTALPSNGASGVISSEKDEDNDGVSEKTTPTHVVQMTPEHKMNKSPPAQLTLTQVTPLTPSQTTPPVPLRQSSLTPAGHVQAAHKHPYFQSHSYAPPTSGGHYSTLPPKKRLVSTSYSQGLPSPQRPSSAEAPPTLSFPRPASAHNLQSAPNYALRARSVTMGTPTKQRPPQSPLSAVMPTRGVVPGSPLSSAGTPGSSCSGSSPMFKFPPKTPEGAGHMTPYRRTDGVRRNPNVKATGVAVEPTTNQERELYGNNMATRVHTIDRKSKLPNGLHRSEQSPVVTPLSPQHPETTIVEINGGYVGCTDC